MDRISLGMNIGHDQGAAIVKNGKLIGAIAQERIDRVKHSYSTQIPFAAIDALLGYCDLTIQNVDNFGFSSTAVNVEELRQYVTDSLENQYGLTDIHLIPVAHHQAHAESTYFTSGFNNAVVLVADGGGEVVQSMEESESIFLCDGCNVKLVEQRLQSHHFHALHRPHNYIYPFMHKAWFNEQISLGKKYEQISNLLGFGGNGAGKVMGLAAYGTSLINVAPQKVLDPFDFELSFSYILQEYYQLFEQSGENYFQFMKKHNADIARSMQDYTENQVVELIDYMLKKYSNSRICLAGGLFLNCPVNHKILERFPEVDLHICPAAGDDGQAMGTAFAAHRSLSLLIENSSSVLPYLGISYSDAQIEDAINARNLSYHRYSEEQAATKVAKYIFDNKIVAFLHGRSEIGPRALCHRSILANPTNPDMKDYINARVKHRENFRPFAPVVTAEAQFTYFDLLRESPYMLLAAKVKDEYSGRLPAVTHVDDTARVQAVEKMSDPYMHTILTEFMKLSGLPVLLNTSFNDNGEPIIESPTDAIQTFLKTEIDVLVMETYILLKEDIDGYTPSGI